MTDVADEANGLAGGRSPADLRTGRATAPAGPGARPRRRPGPRSGRSTTRAEPPRDRGPDPSAVGLGRDHVVSRPAGLGAATSRRGPADAPDRPPRHGRQRRRARRPGPGPRAGRRAVGGAAAWLAARPGVERVAAIGLGLGGLAAAAAIADGAPIATLVLWGAPDTGQAWLREQRAFAALQTSHNEPAAGAGGRRCRRAPDCRDRLGSKSSGLHPRSAETIADVRGLALTDLLPGRLDRALLLDRDGMAPSRKLVDALAGGGTEVTQAAGAGWSNMVFHPEQYFEPVAVFRTVGNVARRGAGGRPTPPRARPGPSPVPHPSGTSSRSASRPSRSASGRSGSSSRSASSSGSRPSRRRARGGPLRRLPQRGRHPRGSARTASGWRPPGAGPRGRALGPDGSRGSRRRRRRPAPLP